MRHWFAATLAGLICGLVPIDSLWSTPAWLAALVAMALAVHGRPAEDLARGAWIGALWYGLALRWVALEWTDLGGELALPWAAWGAVMLLQALVPAVGLGLAGALRRTGWPLFASLALGLAAAEALAVWVQPLPGGWAVFMAPVQPLLWPAAFGGTALWLAVAGGWAGLMASRPTWGLLGLVAWTGLGVVPRADDGPPLRVGLIQPNTGAMDGRRASTAPWREQRLMSLVEASHQAGAQVVVTPEGAWPHRLDTRRDRTHTMLRERFHAFPAVLLGASMDEGDRRTNSLLGIESGQLTERWDKVHLVPVSEQAVWGVGEDVFHPGHAHATHRLGGVPIAARICYEDLITPSLRGLGEAELLVLSSNDAWLGPSLGSRQHEAGARLAAVLTGRWVVRPTNNGRSAVFDPAGRRRWHSPWVDGDVTPQHAGIASVQTVHRVVPWWTGADVSPWLTLLAALLCALGVAWGPRRSEDQPGPLLREIPG
ncbi:MAG: apolipoprotein N-acyltransferase [Myxococcota bacterium]